MTDVAPSRRVAILQSNYVPWKGYFDIIHDVDLFIFYDDNQYTTADWRNRNQIKAAGGVDWISIPVGENQKRLICDVTIPDSRWQAKHWRTITQNYGKCPYFDRYRDAMQEIYLGRTWLNLSELNQTLIRLISTEFLGISTQFADSRQYAAVGQKLDRLVDLVQKSGATTYVSGPSAKDYIVPERFQDIDVELRWKDYSGYPEYPQRFPPFAHGVTILDLLFNVGERAPWYIWGWRDEVPTSS